MIQWTARRHIIAALDPRKEANKPESPKRQLSRENKVERHVWFPHNNQQQQHTERNSRLVIYLACGILYRVIYLETNRKEATNSVYMTKLMGVSALQNNLPQCSHYACRNSGNSRSLYSVNQIRKPFQKEVHLLVKMQKPDTKKHLTIDL